MKLFIFIIILFILFAAITAISPLAMLSISVTIILFIPFLWWLIEITKGFEDLREREKAIEVRRKALNGKAQ